MNRYAIEIPVEEFDEIIGEIKRNGGSICSASYSNEKTMLIIYASEKEIILEGENNE